MSRLGKAMPGLSASVMLMAAVNAVPANAADLTPVAVDGGGWTYTYTQNGWLPGIKGRAGLFGARPVDVDVDFAQIIDAVDWGNFPSLVMSMGEARYGNWGINGEILHMALAVDGTRPGPLAFRANLGLKVTMANAMVSYRVAEEGASYLDMMAGGRAWWVDGDLGLGVGQLAGGASDNQAWIDPMIGIKGKYDLGNNFYLDGSAMVGGFGAASDFTWDVFGGIGYQINENFTASLGWRHLEIDYSSGAFLFDVAIDGPMLQVNYKF